MTRSSAHSPPATSAAPASPRRLLMIDDHPLFRAGLRSTLQQPGLELHFDEASTLLAALDALVDATHFDLILYDWHLPDSGGCKGLIAICQLAPAVPVVVITADEDEAVALAARAIGAADCLSKGIETARMRAALGPFLGPDSVRTGGLRAASDPAPRAALTPRQRDVLQLMARGDPNKRIASQLGIAETTVRAHVSDILHQVQARNRTEAVVRAGREGLLD